MQKVKTFYNTQYDDTFASVLFKTGPIPKWAILQVEVSENQIAFYKKNGVYTYKWSDFSEAFLRSKFSVKGGMYSMRDIKERLLFLKTMDGQEFILDFSEGYNNYENESRFYPNPKDLLKTLRVKLAPIFRYESEVLKIKWLTPSVSSIINTVLATGVFALLQKVISPMISVLVSVVVLTILELVTKRLNSKWILIADPEKKRRSNAK